MRTVSAQTRQSDPYRRAGAGEALAECAPEVVFLFSSIHYGRMPICWKAFRMRWPTRNCW